MDINLMKDSLATIDRLCYKQSEVLLQELGCNADNVHEFEIKQKIGYGQSREFWKNGLKAGEVCVETKIDDGTITFVVTAQLMIFT